MPAKSTTAAPAADPSHHTTYGSEYKHAVEGRKRGNSRNGTRSKTVLTEVGPVELDVPGDRDSTFDQDVAPRRRASGSTI